MATLAVCAMLVERGPRMRKAVKKILLSSITERPEETGVVTRGMRKSMTTNVVRESTRGMAMEMAKYEPRSVSTPPSREPVRIPKTTMSIADKRSFSSETDTITRTSEGVKNRK